MATRWGREALALDLPHFFEDEVRRFVEEGRPVLGICNGFQALLKAGILTKREIRGAQVYAGPQRESEF
jgi:phosphoribosylformylglycinamidine synthase